MAGPWNFGPAQRSMVPVQKLVEVLIEKWGAGAYAMAGQTPSKEAKFLHLDISKAINELGWYPQMDLDEAVKKTVEEYRVEGLPREKVHDQRLRHIDEYQARVDRHGGPLHG